MNIYRFIEDLNIAIPQLNNLNYNIKYFTDSINSLFNITHICYF
jgi:hypothetical protein